MLLCHWYCYMNTNHATYQSQYTELLRRCRHPRVPVKSPSSTCCRPTTFFWCGSRVDAIELLLFRGQNSIKKQSSTTLAATTLAVLTVLYYAILIPNLPPAENDFCLHCLQSTLLLLPYIIGIYGLRYSMLYVCILCTYVTYNFGS